MDFPSADVFEDDSGNCPRSNSNDFHRKTYKARICPSSFDSFKFSSDRDGLKMKADLSYYQKDYEKALSLYLKLYEDECNSQSYRRDLTECIARTYSSLGNDEKAIEYWKIIKKGWASHDDMKLASLQLRLDIATKLGEMSDEVGYCLCQVIETHPTLARYWLMLADWYISRGESIKEYWSMSKAKAVNNLEGTYHSLSKNIIDDRLSIHSIDRSLKKKIDDYILAEVKGISVVDEESKEFVDLGTSVRMKQTEEALLKSTEDAEYDVG